MYNRGVKISHIAQHIDVRTTTVSNALEDITGRTDQEYNWDEVNSALIEGNLLREEESCISETESSVSSVSLSARKSVKQSCPPRSSRSLPSYEIENDRRFVVPGPSRFSTQSQPPAPVISQRSTLIAHGDRASPPPDLDTFLRNLEHNLSKLASDLEAQGIGTIERLLAFAPWSEERLHELFKATLPHITVPQRFILVHGVKKYA
ncbi:hypothetical protein C0993_007892 [Termitomyces sp. T159_Od127]|nr:hypothetical protein C0993_007892 [Termitomyces sp. T159_Od127]